MKLRNKSLIFVLFVVVSLSVLFCYSYFIEPGWIKVKHYSYENSDLPSNFKGLKVGFITDLHSENHSPYKKAVEMMKKEKPDLIIIGGDWVDYKTDKLSDAINEVTSINPKYGIYTAIGNHDNYRPTGSSVRKLLLESSIKVLENDGIWLEKDGQRIRIAAVGDMETANQDLDAALLDAQKSDFTLLISHNPDYFENLHDNRIDLVLSGHTHGGQIGLGFFYPVIPSKYGSKYRTGEKTKDDGTLIVSNGIGMNWIPLRLGARPDISIITLN